MPTERLTADHLATYHVILRGGGQPPSEHDVEAVYFRSDEARSPGYTVFKNEHHKTVDAFPTDRIESIKRTRAPERETSQRAGQHG